MTSLITAHSLSKAFGSQILFQDISFTISAGDRIGLIGPNGAGKSSLIKILAGEESPDSGEISKRQKLRIGYASQSPQFPSIAIEQFLIEQIPQEDPITARTRARVLLGKAEFADSMADASLLSGGWKKRLDIVRALMNEPDLLLLDEPTNHLDLEGILWLEAFLKRLPTAFLLISHDRYFLENVANKVFELNRCFPEGLLQCQGNMSAFMEQKEAFLNALEKKKQELSFKVREEINWLRTSPKARTTKSRSRIQQAYRWIAELDDVKTRSKVHKVDIDFTASERETRKLIVAKNVGKTLGGKELFKQIDLTLSPGTRLGIVGKNGTGKTTLLKILGGTLTQDMGTIKYADDLRIVYFDQHREQINPKLTLKEALSPFSDTVNYRGQQIHVNGWAKKFLFSPDRLNLPVGYLSGGERARIFIAKLMLEPADVLFLDEPTNDLDIATLEVIEESLNSFNGAVVLISHDRCLMESVCTQILGLGENLEHQLYASYEQWEESQKGNKKEAAQPIQQRQPEKSRPKLSYNEKRELEGIEPLISELEGKLEKLQSALEVNNDHSLFIELAEVQAKLDQQYHRWQELLDKTK